MAIKDDILNNLPSFVVRNDLLESVVTASAAKIDDFRTEVEAKPYNVGNTGYLQMGKALRQLAAEFVLILGKYETDAQVRERLDDIYDIHEARGTTEGIIQETAWLTLSTPVITSIDTGWVLGVTFPGLDEVYLGVGKFMKMVVTNLNPHLTNAQIEALVRYWFLPVIISAFFEIRSRAPYRFRKAIW